MGLFHGAPVALFRRGKLVRIEQRRNDRLAIALLGGRDRGIDDLRRSATSRRAYRLDLAAADAAKAEAGRAADAVWAQHQEILDALEASGAVAAATAPFPAPHPRVRRL